MNDAVVLLTGAYHLGNNPGVFQDAQYVGLRLEFPARLTWKPPAAVELIFYTHDIETWGGTGGHAVTINGTEVGRLRDVVNTQHPTEINTITIDKAVFDNAVGGGDEFRLGIAVRGGTLADDFVLTRVETRGFAALLGV
ncbi:MAG: hypothetical protein QNJ62_11580 [Methyloceanibacter sp.]|nr:hypothetical protein [Methyloceanibacter sp.]